MTDITTISEQIAAANGVQQPLRIVGGDSKRHLGVINPEHQVLAISEYSGIIDYHPAELVIRAKAGTPLVEINQVLAAEGQMLAFEPPIHDEASTIGGVVAAGLSGSRRPFAGALRDHTLGVGLVLFDGAYREFGGQVMKNVAGYDVSRLVCGAYGMLGVIADVSLKVLPQPECERTLKLDLSITEAQQTVSRLMTSVSPLSAACFHNDCLMLRLSGIEVDVDEVTGQLDGAKVDEAFWPAFDAQRHDLFGGAQEIWRLSTDRLAPLDANIVAADWGFAQRWVIDPEVSPITRYEGPGHWQCMRQGGQVPEPFQPLSAPLLHLHQQLKRVFDPNGIFNPARMYPEL